MITVKASQRIFTHAEVVNLTGICVEHLRTFVKRHRLGFIARAAETAKAQAASKRGRSAEHSRQKCGEPKAKIGVQ